MKFVGKDVNRQTARQTDRQQIDLCASQMDPKGWATREIQVQVPVPVQGGAPDKICAQMTFKLQGCKG